MKENEKAILEFEMQLKLLINQRLYEKKRITHDMYTKAKGIIIKS